MRRVLAIGILALALIGFAPQHSALAADEAAVVVSAEKIAQKWDALLSAGINLVWFHPGDEYWYVTRYTLLPGSSGFDVKKTDSLVSPYMLIITFSTSPINNTDSPNANGLIKSVKRKGGFKSAEDALANVAATDFVGQSFQRSMRLNYALQKGIWVLKGGNDMFDLYIGRHLTDKENGFFRLIILFTRKSA